MGNILGADSKDKSGPTELDSSNFSREKRLHALVPREVDSLEKEIPSATQKLKQKIHIPSLEGERERERDREDLLGVGKDGASRGSPSGPISGWSEGSPSRTAAYMILHEPITVLTSYIC